MVEYIDVFSSCSFSKPFFPGCLLSFKQADGMGATASLLWVTEGLCWAPLMEPPMVPAATVPKVSREMLHFFWILTKFFHFCFYPLMEKHEIPQWDFSAFHFKNIFSVCFLYGNKQQKKKPWKYLSNCSWCANVFACSFLNLVFKPILKTSNFQQEWKKSLKILKEEVEMLLLFFFAKARFHFSEDRE